jgi:ATP/maltotriose-dependent transcriptional regulator MalT
MPLFMDVHDHVEGLTADAVAGAHKRDLEEGAALVFDSAAMGEELWGVRLNGAAGNSVEALSRLGRYAEAEALLTQTSNRGAGSCTAGPSLLQAAISIRRGRFDEAVRSLATADELTTGLSDLQARGVFHMRCAELALEQGRPDNAYEQVEQALALAAGTDDETFGPEMCALGVRALADRLEDAQARNRHLDAAKPRLLALGLVQEAQRLVAAPGERGGRCTPRSMAFGSMCRAEHSRLHASDPDLWEEAVTRWEAAGEPYPAAYCRWRQGETLLEGRTERSRANECLQHAWRATVKLATLPLRARIERLAQRGRIALDAVDPTGPANGSTLAGDLGLTQREVEVLGQLAVGRSDREIAESLFISKKTASVHVSNLLRKLDVANRVEAGKMGQTHGLG